MPQSFRYNRAARALAEADIFGVGPTAEKFNITTRSLSNWRNRALEDPILSQKYAECVDKLTKDWQEDTTLFMKTSLARLTRLAKDGTKEDAEFIHALAGALKIVGEINIAVQVLFDGADPMDFGKVDVEPLTPEKTGSSTLTIEAAAEDLEEE